MGVGLQGGAKMSDYLVWFQINYFVVALNNTSKSLPIANLLQNISPPRFSRNVPNVFSTGQMQCFYHLHRLRAIRRFASMPVFKSMVHAFVCSRIDYCNSLLIGLPKSRLAPLQSVLNAAARLIARIPRFSHISTFMTEQLHQLASSFCTDSL